MSNDIERELAKILARDNELREAEASEKRKQEAAVAAAVIEWESRVEKVLLPAIELLAAMLKGAGWTCARAATLVARIRAVTRFKNCISFSRTEMGILRIIQTSCCAVLRRR